jgi:hypothetical protein
MFRRFVYNIMFSMVCSILYNLSSMLFLLYVFLNYFLFYNNLAIFRCFNAMWHCLHGSVPNAFVGFRYQLFSLCGFDKILFICMYLCVERCE